MFTLDSHENFRTMKKLAFISFSLLIMCSACLRLDDNLFNQTKIDAYHLDDYEGYVDFRLDASYTIPSHLIHLFTLASQTADESSATTIHALYLGDVSRIKSDTVILYCHGNRDHMDFYWQRAKLLANTGWKNRYGVLMIDYRGFGLSEGKPTEAGMYADVEAALQWLKNNGLSNNRLIMYGFSLGSAPAVKFSSDNGILTPSKLILEAPFANAETMVQDASGLSLPGQFFTDLKINNAEEIKKVQLPLCWLHGEQDNFLSLKTHGQPVYDRYAGKYKEAHIIPGAGHDNVPLVWGFKAYSTAVLKFITTNY